jgi:hypothetical protein
MNTPSQPTPAGQGPANSAEGAPEVHHKLRFGATQSDGSENGSPRAGRKRMSQQSMVMAVVFTVSASAIFGMRTMGNRAGIAMGGQSVEYTPPTDDRTRTYDLIMAELARAQSPLDVTLSEFGKSPFMLEPSPQAVLVDPVSGPALTNEELAALEAERKKAERIAELQAKASELKLQSVMNGRRPLARINGQTVAQGETVLEVFTLLRVEDRSVVLAAEGLQFVLSLEDLNTQHKSSPVRVGKPGSK